nr:MAG TPA: hypothetical protein [Caudoviricetes sp.]
MRLIDADAYKHILNGWLSETYSGRYGSEDEEGAEIFCCICQLDDAPTVDAVPVVRCRDCKYYDPEDWGGITCKAYGGMIDPDENSFCSKGERAYR